MSEPTLMNLHNWIQEFTKPYARQISIELKGNISQDLQDRLDGLNENLKRDDTTTATYRRNFQSYFKTFSVNDARELWQIIVEAAKLPSINYSSLSRVNILNFLLHSRTIPLFQYYDLMGSLAKDTIWEDLKLPIDGIINIIDGLACVIKETSILLMLSAAASAYAAIVMKTALYYALYIISFLAAFAGPQLLAIGIICSVLLLLFADPYFIAMLPITLSLLILLPIVSLAFTIFMHILVIISDGLLPIVNGLLELALTPLLLIRIPMRIFASETEVNDPPSFPPNVVSFDLEAAKAQREEVIARSKSEQGPVLRLYNYAISFLPNTYAHSDNILTRNRGNLQTSTAYRG